MPTYPIHRTTGGVSLADVVELVGEINGTGAYYFGGLTKETAVRFKVGAIGGWITNFIGTAEPVSTEVHFPETLGHVVTNLATADITYVGIDVNGNVIQQVTPFSDTQKRDIISLGSIEHPDRTTITTVYSTPSLVGSVSNRFESFVRAFGILNVSGNVISQNAANLTIKRSAGTMWAASSNFANDPKSPDLKDQAAAAPQTFYRTTRSTVTAINQTNIDPNNYDLNGVLTAVPSNRWTVQRVYVTADGVTAVAYGQATYTSLTNAIDGIAGEAFVEPFFKNVTCLRGYICVIRGAQDLNNVGEAKFVPASRIAGGTSGGTANDPGAVRYDSAQTLTAPQQAQARANIGVVTAGGVALAGNGFGVAPLAVSQAADYTIHSVINIVSATADQWLCGWTSHANQGYGISHVSVNTTLSGADLQVVARNDGLYPATITIGPVASFVGKVKHVVLSVASGVATAYVDGVAVGTSTDSRWYSPELLGAYVGKNGVSDSVQGDVLKLQRFNCALTAEERAAVMRGEVPAALAKVAKRAVASGTWAAAGGASPSASSTTGVTIDGPSGSYVYDSVYAPIGRAVQVGDIVRVRFTSANAPAGVTFDLNTTSGVITSGHPIVNGENVITFTSSVAFSAAGPLFYIGPNAATSWVISGYSIEAIGTVARYEPENVTSLGRWLDSSGNGHDLIPGTGITPLKPQPVQVREAWLSYSIGGSAPTLVGVNKGCIAAAVKTATGVFTTTLASFIPSANRVGAQCNPFEVDPSYVQARGQGIVAVPASQFVMLTKNYNNDILVDVSHTSAVRWLE